MDFQEGERVENGKQKAVRKKKPAVSSLLASFLNESERTQIEEAVKKAESSTSGEIVTVLVPQSSSYAGTRWRIAVAVSFLVALALYTFDSSLNPIFYLLVQLPALLLGFALGNIKQVLRFFLAESQIAQAVHRRALEAFYSADLNSTRDRTGILIFVSYLEHRAVILADQGIHSHVKPESWDSVVRHLVIQIADGKLAAGFCSAVEECGKILNEYFPEKKSSQNQLSNQIIIEK